MFLFSRRYVLVYVVCLLLACWAVGLGGVVVTATQASPAQASTTGRVHPGAVAVRSVPSDTYTTSVVVPKGATLSTLLAHREVPTQAVLDAARPHYNLALLRPGRELSVVYRDGEARPVALRYEINHQQALWVERQGEQWTSRLQAIPYHAQRTTYRLELTRSLWQDGLEAGLTPNTLVRLASIFECELDFNSELRSGAAIAVVADQLSAPGRPTRVGAIYAATLHNGDDTFTAVRYAPIPGEYGYYRADGSPLRQTFLRSPIEFSRVTSGFNPRRYHPILKRRRPHNGTDYGAPTGTPVRAVANGKVVTAGRAGGHGKFVKIEHEGPFKTSYSHLSRIHVKRGQRVRQGDVIGRVGSTGLATGPHLHYQMWKNNRYVDPQRVELPRQPPLPPHQLAGFKQQAAQWLAALAVDAASPMVATTE